MQILSKRGFATSLAVLCMAVTSTAWAGTVNLAWDPLASASGYRVHYGQSPGSYTQVEDVGAATQATITGLADCTNYYFAVKGYSATGESGSFSNQVAGWGRPVVSSTTPATVEQGDTRTLNISGANFKAGATVEYVIAGMPARPPGQELVRLQNISVISCNQIQASMTVEPTARGQRAMEIGTFDIDFQVTNPDSVFGAGSDTLNVVFGEQRADINRSDSTTIDRVDGKDLVWLAYSFGSVEGDANHNPDADLNGDGMVTGDDLVFLAAPPPGGAAPSRFGLCWNGSAWTMAACP